MFETSYFVRIYDHHSLPEEQAVPRPARLQRAILRRSRLTLRIGPTCQPSHRRYRKFMTDAGYAQTPHVGEPPLGLLTLEGGERLSCLQFRGVAARAKWRSCLGKESGKQQYRRWQWCRR